MVCVGPDGPSPTLPEIHLQDIHLTLLDPEDGRSAAVLTWSRPAGVKVTSFEIHQALHLDSLAVVHTRDASESTTVMTPLPDMKRPFTLYFGVRAVLVEPTGQKLYSKAIPVDSLIVTPSLEILSPGSLSNHGERTLAVEVRTSGDEGIVLRQSLFERAPGGWARLLDTCLPMSACGTPIFGTSVQRDALVLQTVPAGDTLQSLYCVLGDESFEDLTTGRKQSLTCTRFFRISP